MKQEKIKIQWRRFYLETENPSKASIMILLIVCIAMLLGTFLVIKLLT